ncbi:hypothetical protein [uncultured Thiodictyon sp.]|uniref:hypothetical protein n=1 Tax=uncultured Thiodictyon sp. TaxID=1846217 RepID=UPI0025E45BAD|nr:hypothetical protein [uncultured Thiodictyon sp.]
MSAAAAQVPGGAAKLISCILPDDGTERRLLHWLRDQPGITRANSVYGRGQAMPREASARRGQLPEPSLVRLVTIVVAAAEADALFDRIYAHAQLHRPEGGTLLMTPLTFATPFMLPEGLANETDHAS